MIDKFIIFVYSYYICIYLSFILNFVSKTYKFVAYFGGRYDRRTCLQSEGGA